MHRYCAGVSVAKFEELSVETDSPLHKPKCLYCEQQAHANKVKLSKSVIETLKAKLGELRESIMHAILHTAHPTL